MRADWTIRIFDGDWTIKDGLECLAGAGGGQPADAVGVEGDLEQLDPGPLGGQARRRTAFVTSRSLLTPTAAGWKKLLATTTLIPLR